MKTVNIESEARRRGEGGGDGCKKVVTTLVWEPPGRLEE